MKKQELLQLLSDFSEQDPSSETYEQRVISDGDFDALADKLVSIFTGKAKNLLADFWNIASDACPLECTEMEDQVVKFRNYVLDQEGLFSVVTDYEHMTETCLRYLNNHHLPHTTIIATPTSVELLEGVKSTGQVLKFVRE